MLRLDPLETFRFPNSAFLFHYAALSSLRRVADESSYGPDFNPDWDGNGLLDSHPYTTGVPFSYTWYSQLSSFSPGRLDYLIYSGSNLMLQNSYSLFTPGLPQDSLNAFNLFAGDAVIASDHLPVVLDFELRNLTAQTGLPSKQHLGILKIHPNPSQRRTKAKTSIAPYLTVGGNFKTTTKPIFADAIKK